MRRVLITMLVTVTLFLPGFTASLHAQKPATEQWVLTIKEKECLKGLLKDVRSLEEMGCYFRIEKDLTLALIASGKYSSWCELRKLLCEAFSGPFCRE